MYQSNFNALIEQLNDMDIRKQFFIKPIQSCIYSDKLYSTHLYYLPLDEPNNETETTSWYLNSIFIKSFLCVFHPSIFQQHIYNFGAHFSHCNYRRWCQQWENDGQLRKRFHYLSGMFVNIRSPCIPWISSLSACKGQNTIIYWKNCSYI